MNYPHYYVNKAKGLIEKLMQSSEYADAIVKFLDGDPHALDNFKGSIIFNELRYEIVAAITLVYFYYQSENLNDNRLHQDILDNCGLSRVIVTSDLKIIEGQMCQSGLLDRTGSFIDSKGNKKIVNTLIILMMDHGVVSRWNNGTKVPLSEIAEYFARRWNMKSLPDISRSLDEKQIQDALKAVHFLYKKELSNPKRLPAKLPLDQNPESNTLSPKP